MCSSEITTLNDPFCFIQWLRPWSTTQLSFSLFKDSEVARSLHLYLIYHFNNVLFYNTETNRCLWHLPPCGGNGVTPRLWACVNNELGPSIVNHRGVLFGWRLWENCMGMACVTKDSLASVQADARRKKEGSFIDDWWWPLPLFVSYGIRILKGNCGDETWAGASYLFQSKAVCYVIVYLRIGIFIQSFLQWKTLRPPAAFAPKKGFWTW